MRKIDVVTATIAAGILIAVAAVGAFIFGGRTTEAQPAPVVQTVTVEAPRPVTDVVCGDSYEFAHLERFNVRGRVAVNFYFGGADRNRQPQYIWDRNVIGQSTEVREARRVDTSLAYSTVTFLCLDDPALEGHKASNVEVMRYRLNLRRPPRPPTGVRGGGPAP